MESNLLTKDQRRKLKDMYQPLAQLANNILCIFPADCRGPDSHEMGQGPHGHLSRDWGGERSRLSERGVRFDFQYISDSLANASWNRFRWTVDVDFGALIGPARLVLPRHGALARWRESRYISGPTDESERNVQRKYDSPRFLVDREALVG